MNIYTNADYDDDEWQDTVYIGGWEDVPTIPCPHCQRDILEDALRCRHCERYIAAEDHAVPRERPWVILTALMSLGAVIWCLFLVF